MLKKILLTTMFIMGIASTAVTEAEESLTSTTIIQTAPSAQMIESWKYNVTRINTIITYDEIIIESDGYKHNKKEENGGTGFFIKGGYILTNYHVISGTGKKKTIQYQDYKDGKKPPGKYNTATLVKVYPDKDIAVLSTNEVNHSYFDFSSEPLQKGDFVTVIGNPVVPNNILQPGEEKKETNFNLFNGSTLKTWDVLSAKKIDSPVLPIEVTKIPDSTKGVFLSTDLFDKLIYHGNSGGPVINSKGQVASIIFGSGDDTSFGITLNEIQTVLKDINLFNSVYNIKEPNVTYGTIVK
ncbi:serine protease [Paenibacillus sp. FSL K6-3166]|uniref:serine protease n=2 Tax=unclassified Paenibacillus TaxID=185978 RepID=UPI0030FA87CF